MIRFGLVGLFLAALAVTWTVMLVDQQAINQVIQTVKDQSPRHVGFASLAVAAVIAALIFVPWSKSRDTGAANSDNAPPDEPPVVTPKRVSNRRLQIRDQVTQDVGHILASGLEVRHLMSDQLVTVQADTKLSDVRKLMEDEGIRHLAVSKAGEYGNVAGVISDRDIITRRGGYAMDIMTPGGLSICHGAKIQDAIDMMTDRGISSLLVSRGEIMCGIITSTDLLIGLRETYEMLRGLVPDKELAAAGTQD